MPRRHALLLVLTACLLSAVPALGEDEFALTAEEIIELKQAGMEDADILAELRATETKPVFTGAQLNALGRAGAGPELLAYLGADKPKPVPPPVPGSGEPSETPPTHARSLWTPMVWRGPGVAPTHGVPERSLAVIAKLSDIQRVYVNAGRYAEAGERYEAYLHMAQAHGFPPWAQALANVTLATARLRLGQVDAGIEALGAAAHLGFADPQSFQEDVPRSLWDDPRIRDVYGRMAIDPADLHELAWIRSELQAMEHDARLLIIANASRVDLAWTQVARVALPARITRNVAVEGWRQALLHTQQRQTLNVMASDRSRKNHLTTMQIIQGESPSDADRFASRQLAERREADQATSVAARQYRPESAPAGGRLLPELGSLGVGQVVAPAVDPVRDGEGSARSAWSEVQPGDWWDSRVTIETGDGIVGRQSIKEWVTARAGPLVSLILIREAEDATTVEDNYSRVLPTNKEQLYFELSLQGPVVVERYEESATDYEFRGRTIAARRIALRFQWTLGGEREPWVFEGIMAPAVCRGAFLELRLQSATRTIHQQLTAWGQ